jgi:hypothetical protein
MEQRKGPVSEVGTTLTVELLLGNRDSEPVEHLEVPARTSTGLGFVVLSYEVHYSFDVRGCQVCFARCRRRQRRNHSQVKDSRTLRFTAAYYIGALVPR